MIIFADLKSTGVGKAVGDRGLRVGEEIQRRRGTGLTNKMFGKGGELDSGNDACTRREGRE
jgi:hypothetical protein